MDPAPTAGVAWGSAVSFFGSCHVALRRLERDALLKSVEVRFPEGVGAPHSCLRTLPLPTTKPSVQSVRLMFSCIGTMPSEFLSLSSFGVLWLLCSGPGAVPHVFFWGLVLALFTLTEAAPCPHCFGSLASCDFASSKTCPLISTVASNAAVITAGAGVLSIAALIKPRFLRIFSRVAFDTILTLAKRKEPGTAFEITADTSATALLTAIQGGKITLEMVLFKLLELAEAATEAPVIKKLKDRTYGYAPDRLRYQGEAPLDGLRRFVRSATFFGGA